MKKATALCFLTVILSGSLERFPINLYRIRMP
jgi:hypothetical protein